MTTKHMSHHATIISELLVKNPSAHLFEPREALDKAVIGFTTTSVRNNVAIYDRDLLREALADSFLNDNDEATDEDKQDYANNGVLEQDVDETLEEMIGELSPNSPLVVKTPDTASAPDGDLRLN
jgi:hypothetical protein